ncbi:MAG TPA: HEPN domain-containing protein [Anaerolineales bacterium]|nr:HEPN domain-containing protein [Anaerolineales bacterium]
MKADQPASNLHGKIIVAAINCRLQLLDVRTLLFWHRRAKSLILKEDWYSLEVFKRAGIIISVTAWETFIEDVLSVEFAARLAKTETVEQTKNNFRRIIKAPIDANRLTTYDLANFSVDDLKGLISNRFNKELGGLHNPNSKNIRDLSTKFLGSDLTTNWQWRKVSSSVACQKLDTLMKDRGRLAHRNRPFERILQRQALDALNLVQQLVLSSALSLLPPESFKLVRWYLKDTRSLSEMGLSESASERY